jgi:ubiquinone biosynthesis protein
MLNPELTPTQLVSAEERTTIRIGPLRKPTPFWVLRFLRIGFRWSMRIARAFVVRRLSATDKARLVGGLLEELGGLWIKAGQLLSLRTDLFSREFCHGLTRLQSHADGFSPAVARQIIEEDLGGPHRQRVRPFRRPSRSRRRPSDRSTARICAVKACGSPSRSNDPISRTSSATICG